MEDQIVNRIAKSPLIQIDLDDFVPKGEIPEYDLKQNLFQELILKEKDFREDLRKLDWSRFKDKNVAVFCSADAIVPDWAFMLIAAEISNSGGRAYYGNRGTVLQKLTLERIKAIDVMEYQGKMILIKGCGSMKASEEIYMEITNMLKPVVKSLMFGEACSTVPVFKR